MKQYNRMTKVERTEFRVKRILEVESPLPSREIYFRLCSDGYYWQPKNVNALGNLLKKSSSFEKINLNGNKNVRTYVWKLKGE